MGGSRDPAAPPAAAATANRWIIGETAQALAEVNAALADYRFDQAADALYNFVWGKVCDWYVEFAKPLFDGADAAETRATMAWVLDQCMILLHPIMPFITEELWQTTGTRAKLLVHTDWPTYGAELIDADADARDVLGHRLIDEIRSARAQMHVPVGLKLDLVQLSLDDAGRAAWARNEALIKRLARIDSLTEAATAPKGAIAIAVEGGGLRHPAGGHHRHRRGKGPPVQDAGQAGERPERPARTAEQPELPRLGQGRGGGRDARQAGAGRGRGGQAARGAGAAGGGGVAGAPNQGGPASADEPLSFLDGFVPRQIRPRLPAPGRRGRIDSVR